MTGGKSWLNEAKEMRSFLHLSTFSLTLFLLDQSVTSSAIVCALLTCPFLISSDVVVSSTYFQSDALLIARSLIMIKNNHGPSLVPWGTPEGTAPHSDTAFREFDFLRAAWKEIYDPIINLGGIFSLKCYNLLSQKLSCNQIRGFL